MLPMNLSANRNRIEHFCSTKKFTVTSCTQYAVYLSRPPFANINSVIYDLYPYEVATYPETNLDGITLRHEFSLASGHLSLELFTRDSQLLGLRLGFIPSLGE